MLIALYVRVSTAAQEARGTIGSQLEALRAYAAKETFQIEEEYLDDGHSGAYLDRPGLDALRDAAEARRFEAVLCLCPDRLARSYAYQVLIMDELARYDVRVLFSDAPEIADDPQARLLTQVQGVIAEYERAKLIERGRRGKLYRARLGEVVSWKAPYGYRRIPRTDSEQARLVIYEPEAVVVRGIFADVVERGLSVRKIVYGLYENDIPSPAGRNMWPCSTVSRLLKNEAYIGRVYYNQTQSVPSRPGSKRATRQVDRPRAEWIAIPVPSFISQATFDAVPPVSRDNSRWSPRRAEPGAWLLRGLVRCGACDVATTCHKMHGRKGECHRYYYCPHHDILQAGGEDRRCPERNIRADALDAFVLEQVHDALNHPQTLLAAEGALAERAGGDDAEILTSQLAKLERRLEGVRRERRRIADLYQVGLIETADMERRGRDIATRLKQLGSEREALDLRSEEATERDTLEQNMCDFGERVLAGWETMDHSQKQRLLRTVLESVHVKGTQVELRFRIPLNEPPSDDSSHSPPGSEGPRQAVFSKDRLRSLGECSPLSLQAGGGGVQCGGQWRRGQRR